MVFIAETAFVTWCFIVLLVVLEVALASAVGFPSLDDVKDFDDTRHLLPTTIGFLVVAPLVENLFLAGIIEFLLIFTLSKRLIVSINAVTFGALHYFTSPGRVVAGLLGFAMMSYSYLIWYESRFSKRYCITVAQHSLSNALTLVVLLLISRFIE